MNTTTPKDGGPAFPFPEGDHHPHAVGMTLRDYFAAKAMAAIIAKLPLGSVGPGQDTTVWAETICKVVSGAYGYADAMLLMREQPHARAEDPKQGGAS